MYNEQDFIQAISVSFQKYQEFGARSSQKLKPIHKFLAETLQSIFGIEYKLHYLGDGSHCNRKSGQSRQFFEQRIRGTL